LSEQRLKKKKKMEIWLSLTSGIDLLLVFMPLPLISGSSSFGQPGSLPLSTQIFFPSSQRWSARLFLDLGHPGYYLSESC